MKDRLLKYSAFAVFGGINQLQAESTKILFGTTQGFEKFPNGFNSMNFAEEFIEGSLPMLLGSVIGQYGYKRFIRVFRQQYNPHAELASMAIGGMIGYSSMVVTGAILHSNLGVSDIKWGPFR